MPNAERREWTEAGLKKRITGCTLKIGIAVRDQDDATADTLRERRGNAISKLIQKFQVYTLVNPEGKTEFVDKAEWEQRMIAWGRRNGQLRRPRVNLDASRPATPPPSAGNANPPATDAPPAPPTVPGA